MTGSRIRLGHAYGEVAPNTWNDFDWLRSHEQELLEQYGECIVLVYHQRVIGTGNTIDEAVADAEAHLPADIAEATPIMDFLHHRQPFFHIRPDKI